MNAATGSLNLWRDWKVTDVPIQLEGWSMSAMVILDWQVNECVCIFVAVISVIFMCEKLFL